MEEQFSTLLVKHQLSHLQEKLTDLGVYNKEIFLLIEAETDWKEIASSFVDRLKLRKFQKLLQDSSNESQEMETLTHTLSTADTIILDENFEVMEQHTVEKTTEELNVEVASNIHQLSPPSASSEDRESLMRPSKKIKSKVMVTDVSIDKISLILNSSAIGKPIIKYYHSNNSLTPKLRAQLVQATISALIDDNSKSMTSQTISELADTIISLFPTESKETYYLVTNTKTRRVCSGKLYDRYKNQKYFLKQCDSSSSAVGECSSSAQSLSSTESISDNDLSNVLWLKNNNGPLHKVQDLWKKTTHIRAAKNKQSGTLSSIIQEWPALNEPEGYTLVSFL